MERLDEDHYFSTRALYDIKLVERALKHNDQKAYAELMERYWESVYFMLLRMMKNNKDDAEDLTMEAFGNAFRFLHQYSKKFAFSTWVFKIASNNAIDFIRKNREHKGLLSLDVPDGDEREDLSAKIKGSGLTPEESMVHRQNVEKIRIVIEKLKPNYKEIVELYYIEELTNEEVAQRVNLPLSTVKTRLFRARDLLLTIIQEEHKD